MEIDDEGVLLDSYLNVRACVLALKFLAVAHRNP